MTVLGQLGSRIVAAIGISVALLATSPSQADTPAAGTSPPAVEPLPHVAEPIPTLSPERATLELHAHLFMKEGMTWAFRGDFDGPLKATDWTQRFSSQANPESMNRSEAAIVVATLYANPFFTISLRESIRRQIRLAADFVANHPEWTIGRDAAQTRAALAQGKRVLILALEGASDIIETEEDLKEFVDTDGIRIVNLLHLTDDEYGGVAFEHGFYVLSSPWAWVTQLFNPLRDPDGIQINSNGLSEKGRAMAASLMKRHVWVDLAHSGDLAQKELIPMFEGAGLPLLYTHTVLRKYMRAERAISAEQLVQVAKSGGMLGLMPSETMLEGTVPAPGLCGSACHAPCEGALPQLAQQYSEIASVLKPEQIALGSDYNGGVHHLPPPPCPLGTSIDTQGLWNIGQQGAVWDSLAKLGLPVLSPRRKMIDHFLDAWERVNPATGPSSSRPTRH